MKIGRIGLAIGIIGGIGVGLLLGSEFSGRLTTLVGAGFIFIYLFLMLASYMKK